MIDRGGFSDCRCRQGVGEDAEAFERDIATFRGAFE